MTGFRPLLRSDIPELVRMSRENMSSIVLSSWGMQWTDEPLLQWLSDKDVFTEVLEEEGELLCYFSLEFVDNYAFIASIQVRKDRQGQGLGRKMMVRIEEIAQDKDLEGVELYVQETNLKAKEFYLGIGYRTICRKGNNFLMRHTLRPVGKD